MMSDGAAKVILSINCLMLFLACLLTLQLELSILNIEKSKIAIISGLVIVWGIALLVFTFYFAVIKWPVFKVYRLTLKKIPRYVARRDQFLGFIVISLLLGSLCPFLLWKIEVIPVLIESWIAGWLLTMAAGTSYFQAKMYRKAIIEEQIFEPLARSAYDDALVLVFCVFLIFLEGFVRVPLAVWALFGFGVLIWFGHLSMIGKSDYAKILMSVERDGGKKS